jgi:hypothetical protein
MHSCYSIVNMLKSCACAIYIALHYYCYMCTINNSLGYWERDDLGAVVDYLRASGDVGAIALWGRSMGAATALLHGDRDPSIAAMVSHLRSNIFK